MGVGYAFRSSRILGVHINPAFIASAKLKSDLALTSLVVRGQSTSQHVCNVMIPKY